MQLTSEELSALNRAILTRYGMDFSHYEPVSFKRRVSKVIGKFQLESSLGLWSKLIHDKEFIYTFIDEITVGLTEMFRNHDFWIKLREEVLPEFYSEKSITVWHAGCATGEEVYSMVILLAEENLLRKTALVATDLSPQAIRSAETGKFPMYCHKTYAANYVAMRGKRKFENYFQLEEDEMRIHKMFTRNIEFFQHNLSKDPMQRHFNLIFCRNVMIYFDEVLKMKVLKLFYDALEDDGFLIIGYYDALPAGYQQYFKIADPQIKLFRKINVLQSV
jgi:chemotaxis protein methyltransferase CheR